MSGVRQWIFAAIGMAGFACCCNAQTNAARSAFTPAPVAEAGWIRSVANQQGVLTNQPCELCFIGDSLTEFWLHTGRASWEAVFAPLKAVNLGLAADRTEHILNRIQRLEFRRANPKMIVIMMGTNNLGMDPPDPPADVVRAVKGAVELLRRKMPAASILLLTIPPSGIEPRSPLRQRIKQANELIAGISWPAHVRVLPVYEAMVDDHDRWREGFTLDGTHFSEVGYARLADLVSPVVKEMLASIQGEKP